MSDSDYKYKPLSKGIEEGDKCNRNGCEGILRLSDRINCSCHISPPCSYCMDREICCPECDWKYSDDYVQEKINGFIVDTNKNTRVHEAWKLRELDKTKIDYHNFSHSNSSRIKRGVYPEGTSIEDVRKEVIGTFGGRFNYFRDGKFEYVAYTD